MREDDKQCSIKHDTATTSANAGGEGRRKKSYANFSSSRLGKLQKKGEKKEEKNEILTMGFFFFPFPFFPLMLFGRLKTFSSFSNLCLSFCCLHHHLLAYTHIPGSYVYMSDYFLCYISVWWWRDGMAGRRGWEKRRVQGKKFINEKLFPHIPQKQHYMAVCKEGKEGMGSRKNKSCC